ncbi:MAG TPA: peptide chain release factor N(5)-glutamine methyltransferase [Proteobacteria bacterium]|nr:peptide chain release factor N(5)-glutamine methyltransferase [Pseudomonadota bacterium]
MSSLWTVLSLLNWAAPYLAKYGISSPRLDAELLLARVLACPRLDLYLRFDQPLAASELASFKELILERRRGVPVAYLLGEKEFWSLPFKVSPAVLVPRPETEHLVEEAITFLENTFPHGCGVLDLGTGCGNIILALARHFSQVSGFSWCGVDLRPAALEIACINARQLGLPNVSWLQSDLFAEIGSESSVFGLIVANPPYIVSAEMAGLPSEVRHEPAAALDGGVDGLDFYRRISVAARRFMLPGAGLMFEVGDGQAEAVKNILASCGYSAISTRMDLACRERVVRGLFEPRRESQSGA